MSLTKGRGWVLLSNASGGFFGIDAVPIPITIGTIGMNSA